MRFTVAASLLLCVVAVAHADDAADARAHYKAATGHFAVGEFAQAAAEYEAAFKLHQDPALLFNAAQSRRLAGENSKALVLYKNFLNLYPDSKQAPTVREQIAKLQEAVAAEDKAKSAPPTNTVEPNPPPPSPQAAPPPPVEQQAQTTAPPPRDERPRFYKKWWFWTAVGGAVVLAVVIPVAIVESASNWTNLPDQGPGAKASRLGPSLAVQW